MKVLWDRLQQAYVRLADPIAGWLIRHGVSPNTITTVGTLCTVTAGGLFAFGHIRAGAWLFGLTAIFDVLDGMVARRAGQATRFGAFYDSTLDRVADGAILGGIAIFYAMDPVHQSPAMVAVTVAGVIGAFVTSYTRARAEALGVDAKVGLIQRPERVILLSAPQAFFGLALDGMVLQVVMVVLTVTSWITVYQRMHFVYRTTTFDAVPTSTESPTLVASVILPGEHTVAP
jgi:CDP-diacylglycerol---glycerol-3-phosphate 3-phosphatidyltransferase